MQYRPNLGYVYPEQSDEHMITVKHIVDTNFDDNYNYLDKSLWYKIKRVILWICLQLVAFPFISLYHGLKIYGRKNIKKNKKLFKKGAITISNHVLMLDYLCVLKGIRPHLQYHPGWATNFEGKNRMFIRWVGGIPVPTNNYKAMAKFSKTIDEVLENDKWLHFFPEGSMWFYYPDIRPIKKAVFKFAVKHNKPLIPMAIRFRERKGLYKLFGKKPCASLYIGEPMLPNLDLPFNEAVEEMRVKAYHEMQVLAGINPGDPTYNTDLNIKNYKKTM